MRALVPLALASVLAGCSDRIAPADPSAARDAPAAPRTQPLAPDGSVARDVTSLPDRTRVQADLATLRAALRNFHGEHGAWPASLAEIALDGAVSYPADLAYDASSGTVTSRAYPTL